MPDMCFSPARPCLIDIRNLSSNWVAAAVLNFALNEIDWQARTMTLGAVGLDGKPLIRHTVSLDDLSP